MLNNTCVPLFIKSGTLRSLLRISDTQGSFEKKQKKRSATRFVVMFCISKANATFSERLKMHKQSIIKSALWIFLTFLPAIPWTDIGHETIALIAQHHLTPTALKKVNNLLRKESLPEASLWADAYRNKHRNTGPWHYINLSVRQDITKTDIPQFYGQGTASGDNIVVQLNQNIDLLKNPKASFKDRQTALKFVIHFAADIHMPLHVGGDGDRGGNDKQVRYFPPDKKAARGHVTNLHALWDNLIEIKADEDPTVFAAEVDAMFTTEKKQAWAAGLPEDWAIESYLIAKKKIYAGFTAGPTVEPIALEGNYYANMRPVVYEQLEKAGLRLAGVLNEIFKESK